MHFQVCRGKNGAGEGQAQNRTQLYDGGTTKGSVSGSLSRLFRHMEDPHQAIQYPSHPMSTEKNCLLTTPLHRPILFSWRKGQWAGTLLLHIGWLDHSCLMSSQGHWGGQQVSQVQSRISVSYAFWICRKKAKRCSSECCSLCGL